VYEGTGVLKVCVCVFCIMCIVFVLFPHFATKITFSQSISLQMNNGVRYEGNFIGGVRSGKGAQGDLHTQLLIAKTRNVFYFIFVLL
jgi:hypothetical protein